MSDYEVPAGTNYTDAIRDILRRGFPGISCAFPPLDRVTPHLTYRAALDPWRDSEELANAINMTLGFDEHGRCVMRELPTPLWPAVPSPAASAAEGQADRHIHRRQERER